MGAFYQSRLSFMRVLPPPEIEGWHIDRPVFEIIGAASVWRLTVPVSRNLYTLIAFAPNSMTACDPTG